MGLDSGKKKKSVLLGVSGILLVAMVIGAVVGVNQYQKAGDGNTNTGAPASSVQTSTKAVQAICQPTDYKETCEQSLSSAKNTSDPKELIKAAFQAAVDNIGAVIKNSTLLQDAAKDNRIQDALDTCKYVLNVSIEDLKRSFDKVGSFDITKLDDVVADLKTWLSGSLTYQETCIDAFENTTGDTGEKMKKLLKMANELTSNGLAMVTDFSEILTTMGFSGINRRLFSAPAADNESYPSYVDDDARRLLAADPAAMKPNAVVALDGSGQFKSINDAIKTAPKKSPGTFIIFVKAGIYNEYVEIPKGAEGIVLVGEGPLKTRITGKKSFADGIGTFHTATVAVNADRFIARDIAFENSAGAVKHQAVALRVSGDRALFFNCHMNAYQDTLYTHAYRQFYRDCTISGTIDFIFGDAAAVFQNCKLIVRKPMANQACMVTAQGRKDRRSVSGIFIQNCEIRAEPELLQAQPPIKSYLGRPWKEFSRTVFMQSYIDGFIDPEGWAPWTGNLFLDTLYFGEYQNRGPGSNMARRVTWKGIQKITPQIAQSFTAGPLLKGDDWIKPTGFPYEPGMMRV